MVNFVFQSHKLPKAFFTGNCMRMGCWNVPVKINWLLLLLLLCPTNDWCSCQDKLVAVVAVVAAHLVDTTV